MQLLGIGAFTLRVCASENDYDRNDRRACGRPFAGQHAPRELVTTKSSSPCRSSSLRLALPSVAGRGHSARAT